MALCYAEKAVALLIKETCQLCLTCVGCPWITRISQDPT